MWKFFSGVSLVIREIQWGNITYMYVEVFQKVIVLLLIMSVLPRGVSKKN